MNIDELVERLQALQRAGCGKLPAIKGSLEHQTTDHRTELTTAFITNDYDFSTPDNKDGFIVVIV